VYGHRDEGRTNLANLHDRGLDRSRKLEARAWPLGFEKIDGGLEFLFR